MSPVHVPYFFWAADYNYPSIWTGKFEQTLFIFRLRLLKTASTFPTEVALLDNIPDGGTLEF